MARHKSIRLDDEIRRLLTARMVATSSKDESVTIQKTLLDGLKSPRPASPNSVATSGNSLPPADWDEVRKGRQAAMKANPDFSAKYLQLAAKMRAFQVKLNVAMVQENPSIAPLIAKTSLTTLVVSQLQ